VGEVPLAEIAPVKESTQITRFVLTDQNLRWPSYVSAGCHLDGAALPSPDIRDSPTLLAGVFKRFCFEPPTPEPGLLEELKDFVQDWLLTNLIPLAPDTDVSFETWLEGTSYTETRRAELKLLWESSGGQLRPKDANVKMFMKAESYTDYKHARAINSRSDLFKIKVGPIFSAIEKSLFKLKWFIKKIPVADRPAFILERLFKHGSVYLATDFTSFESLFTKEIMEAVEFQLYRHATSALPNGQEFMELVETVLGGENTVINKNISMKVKATRMSGEMCTSLGNGFSNLMFMLFLCHKLGSEVVGVVEGDDGLFRVTGAHPTSDDFRKLGLVIKLEVHETLNTASFCGQVFDLVDMSVVTDPKVVLAAFGWVDGRYVNASASMHKSLLRAKAWSFGYQYPATPIISAMSRAYLRLTRSYDHRRVLKDERLNGWEREYYQEAFDAGRPELNRPVGDATRLLMETLYGVSVSTQKAYEAYFDSLGSLEPIPKWFDVPGSWTDYANSYVYEQRYDFLVNRPVDGWRRHFDVVVPIDGVHMDCGIFMT
jgi:hypothetical protein